jgi:adenylate kinase family enzyme
MKKILVIGCGGSGKSTFAQRLGEKLQLPVIHLDSIYWQPNWIEMPKDEWRQTVSELLAGEAWVMDGNYSGTLELRLAACDTVLFLDLPRRVCLWRVAKRWIEYRGRNRPDMASGCNEKIDLKFLAWIWNYQKRNRPKVLAQCDRYAANKRIVRLRSTNEMEKFLAQTEA